LNPYYCYYGGEFGNYDGGEVGGFVDPISEFAFQASPPPPYKPPDVLIPYP